MRRSTAAILVALSLGAVTVAAAPAAFATSRPAVLTIPGNNVYPESIAAAPNRDLFVSSIVTGEIFRFPHEDRTAETFVPAGVNIGTAGILVDPARKVLWACAIDLSFQTPTMLRAFDLSSATLVASYELPDRGVCADIALANGAVYVTDTTDPTVTPPLPGRVLRLATPDPRRATGGTLTVWSADPLLTGAGGGLQVNGIAFDGHASLYTTNYTTGELIRLGIAADGSAQPAAVLPLAQRFTNPDGIRMFDRHRLLVTENPGRLSVVDVHTGATTLVSGALDQPTSVIRAGADLWVTEGQVLRLQTGQAPNLPFKVRRLPLI